MMPTLVHQPPANGEDSRREIRWLSHPAGHDSNGARLPAAAMTGRTGGPYTRPSIAWGSRGMIFKRRSSTYRSGTTTDWLKIKCYDTDEFEIIAVERERGK